MQEFRREIEVPQTQDENCLVIERMSSDELGRFDALIEASRSLPEVVYEGCMHARVCEQDRTKATLVIRFTSGLDLERLPIHRHSHSSRKIRVASGRGEFHFKNPRTGSIEKIAVERGTYVGFPKGLFHSFTTGDSEMLVVAVHEPFQELDDPEILEHGHGFETARATGDEVTLPVRIPLP